MTTPKTATGTTVSQAAVDKVVGHVFSNRASRYLHMILDPTGTGEKLKAKEDLKKNLRLAVQAYRQERPGASALSGQPLPRGVHIISGGKLAASSATGQVDQRAVTGMNPFFATYIQVSGDIWRGIVPGKGTAGERFYDVMAAPVAFYFTRDTVSTLLAANYEVLIANGGVLVDESDPADPTPVGAELSAGDSTIYVSAHKQEFVSRDGRITVINPAVSVAKVMIEQAADIAGGTLIHSEGIGLVKDLAGAPAGAQGFLDENKELGRKITGKSGLKTDEEVYALVFSSADGDIALPCNAKVVWASAQGVGSHGGTTGTLYHIPAISIGSCAGALLDLMKGVFPRGTAPTVDAATITGFAELAGADQDAEKARQYREIVTEWAEATYLSGRFPKSLTKINGLDALIGSCIAGGKPLPKGKAKVTEAVRAQRYSYYMRRIEAIGNLSDPAAAKDRVRLLAGNHAGDDQLDAYLTALKTPPGQKTSEVIKLVTTRIDEEYAGQGAGVSCGLADDPAARVAARTRTRVSSGSRLDSISGAELQIILEKVQSLPGTASEALADSCVDAIVRRRAGVRERHFSASVPLLGIDLFGTPDTVSARDGLVRLLNRNPDVASDQEVKDFLRACQDYQMHLNEAAAYVKGRGLSRASTGIRSAAKVAEQRINTDWTRSKFLKDPQVRAAVDGMSGEKLLRYFSGEGYLNISTTEKFWSWVRGKLGITATTEAVDDLVGTAKSMKNTAQKLWKAGSSG